MFQSTLPSEKESDWAQALRTGPTCSFNPRSPPKRRATVNRRAVDRHLAVSIHAPLRKGERPDIESALDAAAEFQSTLPSEKESDRNRTEGFPSAYRFQSTLPSEKESDATIEKAINREFMFQSTLPSEKESD